MPVRENKKESKLYQKDCDNLFDLIEGALLEWYEVNHDDKFDSTEMCIPVVFNRFLVSHFVHHFEISEESINHYLQMFKDQIYNYVEENSKRIQREKNTVPLTQQALA
tara:strand:- start:150 stop:473 length:324 start_codon:yes stop_codon:yes gene_type:complete